MDYGPDYGTDYSPASAERVAGKGIELSSLSLGIGRKTKIGSGAIGGLDIINSVLEFDGSTEHALGVQSVSFQTDVNIEFAVSIWFKTSSGSLAGMVGSEDGVNTQDLLLGINNNKLHIATNSGSISAIDLPDVNDNQWHHALFTRKVTGALLMALDGVFSVQIINDSSFFAAPEMTLGSGRSAGGTRWFAGRLSSVSFYDRELVQVDVDELVALGGPRLLTLLGTVGNMTQWNRLGEGDAVPILTNVLRPTFKEYDQYRIRFNGDGGLSKRITELRAFVDDTLIPNNAFPSNMTDNETPSPFVASAKELQDPTEAYICFDGDLGSETQFPATFTDGDVAIDLGGLTSLINRVEVRRGGSGREVENLTVEGKMNADIDWTKLTEPLQTSGFVEDNVEFPLQESWWTNNMDQSNVVTDTPVLP